MFAAETGFEERHSRRPRWRIGCTLRTAKPSRDPKTRLRIALCTGTTTTLRANALLAASVPTRCGERQAVPCPHFEYIFKVQVDGIRRRLCK